MATEIETLRSLDADKATLAHIIKKKLAAKYRGDDARVLGEVAIVAAADEVDPESMAMLATILGSLQRPKPLSVMPKLDDPDAPSWDRHPVDAAIVELVLSVGLLVATPTGPARTYSFWLYHWARREPLELDRLERVAAHPYFGEVLAASALPTGETNDGIGTWLERAGRLDVASMFASLDGFAKTITESWTLGALSVHEAWLDRVCQPAILARAPKLAAAIRALDPARLLRNQLRAGVMDEWGWPAREEALAQFPADRHAEIARVTSGPMPYGVLFDPPTGHIVAFDTDAIVLDHHVAPSKKRLDVRTLYYAGGDVLIGEYGAKAARWALAGGARFEADSYGFYFLGHDDALITKSNLLFRAGDRRYVSRRDGGDAGRSVWSDGSAFYDVAQEVRLDGDGTPVGRDDGEPFYSFDPTTGTRTGHALPAWMAGLVGDGTLTVDVHSTFVYPVPKSASKSPLGAAKGLGGFALYSRDGEVVTEGVDGRRVAGQVNGNHVAAVMTFPGRAARYPVIERAFDLGIAMPDGTTPLVPIGELDGAYWAGTPKLALRDWYSLRPRDLAASRALAKCTDEAARKLVEGVAVSTALPAVTHPRLVAGIAGLVGEAARLDAVIARLRSHLAEPAAMRSDLETSDAPSLAKLFDHTMHWWIEKLGLQLGQQIVDVSQYLFGDQPADMATPARTTFPWHLLLTRMGELLYRILAAGTSKPRRVELTSIVKLWLATGFPSQLARVRVLDMTIDARDLPGLDGDHPDRLVTWDNHRYFIRHRGTAGAADKRVTLEAIEVSPDGTFRTPRRATLVRETPADTRFDVAALRSALALADERGPVPFDAKAVKAIAAQTKLGVAAATLVWAAGYDPWLSGEKKLARFHINRTALDRAEAELARIRLRELYADAMPEDPAQLYDGAVMTKRLVAAWKQAKQNR